MHPANSQGEIQALCPTTPKEQNLPNKIYFELYKNENTVYQNLWDATEEYIKENV